MNLNSVRTALKSVIISAGCPMFPVAQFRTLVFNPDFLAYFTQGTYLKLPHTLKT